MCCRRLRQAIFRFRSPEEINEGNDRSWIGLTKQVSFRSGRIILAIGLAALAAQGVAAIRANGFFSTTGTTISASPSSAII